MPDGKARLLSIDIGTTHTKVGLFHLDGTCLKVASQPTPVGAAAGGYRFIPPDELWSGIARLIAGLHCSSTSQAVAGIGIASTAESGQLVDRADGSPRSAIFPWFDTSAGELVEVIKRQGDERERFIASGVYPSFKCSLAKILWARQRLEINLRNAVWLSVADAIAFRLTGSYQTDYSLAGRTYAFRIAEKVWDKDWLRQFNLTPDLFPPARPSVQPAGRLAAGAAALLDLPAGIPVCTAGHDHICAGLASGAFRPGIVLDSMGTAEALVGAFPERPLTEIDYQSGFSIGCHTAPGRFYWIGGLSTSGGAIEWLRKLVSDDGLSYEDLNCLLEKTSQDPGDILFFPYLAGSGSPHTDQEVRGAFAGLHLNHTLGDLLKAALEGTAFEVELMRRQGETLTGRPIQRLIAAGGGVRNPRWLQIKADVSGCEYELAHTSEAVLLGAALVAAVGAGEYAGVEEALAAVSQPPEYIFHPDAERHVRYASTFEQGFLRLQQPLRDFYRNK
jgi:sugar (pentulose or hexulose) kinase